jgi:ribA/ribD-fused uncharacterized protein
MTASPPITHFAGHQYRWLSNFFLITVDYEGERYPSVEHAYQAAKTNDKKHKRIIRMAGSAAQSKVFGRQAPRRPDWDQVKLQVMETLLRAKFDRDMHPDMRQRLKDTGDAELIEGNWWNDTYWGVCKGVGENHLGKLLMKIRSEC